jgi:hypothetical protein
MYNPQLAEVRYIDHLFSIYIKSMGKHTVCRLEEKEHPTAEKPTIEFVNDIFNPPDRFERKLPVLIRRSTEAPTVWGQANMVLGAVMMYLVVEFAKVRLHE